MTDFCGVVPLAIGKAEISLVKPYLEPLQSPENGCSQGRRNIVNPEVVKDQTYPLTRKIYVVIQADGNDRQKAGEAYANLLMTQQGQNLLEKSGFVSIK
jgi:phosphate transport system substrate-binding protein